MDHGASQVGQERTHQHQSAAAAAAAAPERGCPRREEPPAGAGSRRPNSVTVASTDGVLLLLESRLGAFGWGLGSRAGGSWLELCELVVVVE